MRTNAVSLGMTRRGWIWLVAVVAGCPADGGSGSGTENAASSSEASTEAGATPTTTPTPVTGDGTAEGGSASTSGPTATATGMPPAETGTADSGSDSGGVVDTCGRFPAVDDFGAAGPFATEQIGEGPQCTIFRPATLGEGGLRHPVILWGNGTATVPAIYGGLLTHWASHGFIVAAANTSNAGTGQEMLACLDWLTAQDADPASPYAGVVDLAHVGASGHSQGGGGSLMAGQDPRVVVTAPLQPYTEQGFGGYDQACQSNQNGPMFMMSGDADFIAPPQPNQQRVFDDSNVPTLWATLAGADHILSPIGNATDYRAPATAWFRFHLMCDATAEPVFYDTCELCNDPQWSVMTKNW